MIATDNEVLWDDAGIAEQRSDVIGMELFCIECEEGRPPSAHEGAAAGNSAGRA